MTERRLIVRARQLRGIGLRLSGSYGFRLSRQLVGFAIAVTVTGYLGYVVVVHWSRFVHEARQVSALALALAALCFLGSTSVFALAWVRLVAGLSRQRAARPGLWQAFGVSWLVRYLPGKVFGPLSRVHRARQLGYSVRLLTGSIAYEFLLGLPATAVLAPCWSWSQGCTPASSIWH